MAQFFQFPAKVEPVLPPSLQNNESVWHYPWSEPVRQKIAPALAIALISASGSFAPVLNPDTQVTQNFESKWHQAWSDPVREKPYEVESDLTTFGIPAPVIGWHAQLAEPVRFLRISTAQQCNPLVSIPFNEDQGIYPKWGFSWSEPVRLKVGLSATEQQTLAAIPFNEDQNIYPKWGYAWSEPVRSKPGLGASQQQFLAWNFTPPAVIVTPIDWAQEIYQPRPDSYEVVSITDTFGVPAPTIGWSQWWSEPVRLKPGLSATLQQSFAWNTVFATEVITVDKWIYGLTDPIRQKPGLLAALQQFYAAEPFGLTQPETVTESRWHQPWSEPQRQKLRSAEYPVLAYGYFTPPSSTTIEWWLPLSEPVRRGPFTAAQPTFSYSYFTAPTRIEWFSPWQDPVRQKPGLGSGYQQALAFHTNPIVSFGWYGALVDPSKPKTSILTASQQWLAFVKASPFPEDVKVASWLQWMAEPVRLKIDLRASLQLSAAYPPRVLPNSVIVTMTTIESNKDVFQAAIMTSEPSAKCLVSVREIPIPNQNPWSVRET